MSARELSSDFYAYVNQWKTLDLSGMTQIHALVDRSVRDLTALHALLLQRKALETETAGSRTNPDGVPKQMLSHQDKDNKRALKPPPDLLSINDLRAVYTALEVLWRWCIQPSLENEFNIQYKDHQILNHPKTLLLSAIQLKGVYERVSSPDGSSASSDIKKLCFKATKVLLDVIHSTMFSNLMQGRFLGRCLFALLGQAVHKGGKTEGKNDDGDNNGSAEARVLLDKCARGEVGVGAAKSSIVAALREASQSFSLPVSSTDKTASPSTVSTPATAIKVKASHCMIAILLTEGGLQAVLQGYLEGTLESTQSLKMKQHVARLVTSVPQEYRTNIVKRRDYFSNVLGQLTLLYVLGVRNRDQQLVSILTLIVDRMAQLDTKLTIDRIMYPLAAPFLLVLPTSTELNIDIYRTALEAMDSDKEDKDAKDVVSTEYICSSATLVLAGQVLLALLTTVPLSRATYSVLHASGVGLGLVYAALHTTSPSGLLPLSGASNSLRGLLESCCVEYLGRGLPVEVSLDLKRSAMLNPVQGSKAGVRYHYGTDGEARLVVQKYSDNGRLRLPGGNKQASSAMDVSSLLQAVSSLSSGEEDLPELVASLDISDEDLDSGVVLQQILATAASRLPGVLSPQQEDGSETNEGLNIGDKRIEDVVRVGARGTALASLVVNLYSMAQGVDGEDSESKDTNKVHGVKNAASELFMDCLRVFLAPEDGEAVESRTDASIADGEISTSLSPPASTDGLLLGSKSLNGLLLLQLQSHIKMDILMHDLSRMLQLLLSFLISCTAAIDQSPHLAANDEGNDNTASDDKTTPLIQVIGEDEEEKKTEEEQALGEERETLVAVLGLLDTILSLSASADANISSDSDDQGNVVVGMKQTFMQMLPYLQRIAAYEQLQSLSDEASDLCLTILTLGMSDAHVGKQKQNSDSSASIVTVSSLIEEHTGDLYAEQPPLRAMGVKQLVDSLLHLNIKAPLEQTHVSQVVQLLVSLLRQEDESYVYLAILHALSALSQPVGQRQAVLEALLPLYRTSSATEALSFSLAVEQHTDMSGLSHRQRCLVAEALMLMLRRAGGLGPVYVSTIIPTSLQVIRDTHPNAQSNKSNDQPLLLLRQSSISLLADAVKSAGPAIHKYLVDVLDVCRSVLTMEIDRGNPGIGEVSNRNSRRAAAYVIKLLVQQHGNALLKLPAPNSSTGNTVSVSQEAWLTEADRQSLSLGGYMRDLYRLLKQVIDNDADHVVQLHVGMTLSLVADVVREELQKNVGVNEKVPTIKIL